MPMNFGAAFVDVKGAAELVGRDARWFYRNRDKLWQRHAFPLPVPGPGRLLFLRDDVIAWRNRQPIEREPPREHPATVEGEVLARAGLAGSS
jgi:hypothetical protein